MTENEHANPDINSTWPTRSSFFPKKYCKTQLAVAIFTSQQYNDWGGSSAAMVEAAAVAEETAPRQSQSEKVLRTPSHVTRRRQE